MNNKTIIGGYGELIFDHIFRKKGEELYYLDSRGGGTVWNVLSNLSCLGCRTYGFGVCGDDTFGNAALQELSFLKVNIDNIELIEKKRTRIIFEIVNESEKSIFPTHSFSESIELIKRKIPKVKLASSKYRNFLDKKDVYELDLICFDRLTKDRVSFARELQKEDTLSLIDIGRVSDFRFRPVGEIVKSIGYFNIAVAPNEVEKSIIRRIGIERMSDLFNISKNLKLIVITGGISGVKLYIKGERLNSSTMFEIDGIISLEHKDSCGAGDTFLAHFLFEMDKRNLFVQFNSDLVKISPLFIETAQNAVRSVEKCLNYYGARGHLPKPASPEIDRIFASFKNKNLRNVKAEGWSDFYQENVNKLSFNVSKAELGVVSMKRNVSLLINKLLFTIEKLEAQRRLLAHIKSINTAYVVGTGGSFAAAVYIALFLRKYYNIFATPIRPYDYIRTASKSDCLFIISHSGSTHDCGLCIEHSRCLNVKKVILVTSSTDPKLSYMIGDQENVISYGWKKCERGFISIAGTICPCTLFASVAYKPEDIIMMTENVFSLQEDSLKQIISSIVRAIKCEAVIQIFGSGLGWPTMLDLESKFVEGALGIVQLHESKDFSHGRFMSVFDKNTHCSPKVIILTGKEAPYELKLIKELCKFGPLSKIQSKSTGGLGALENLITSQYLIQGVAYDLKKNISKPDIIPNEGLKLYKWKKKL